LQNERQSAKKNGDDPLLRAKDELERYFGFYIHYAIDKILKTSEKLIPMKFL